MTTLSELKANYDAGIDVTQTDLRILFKCGEYECEYDLQDTFTGGSMERCGAS